MMKPPMLSFDEALARLLAGAQPLSAIEEVDTFDANGRVLARDQMSAIDVPPHDNSSMDGYAVRLADLPSAGVRLRVDQRIPAGSVGHSLEPGSAARIFTGAPVPAGADAVVMQELCERDGDEVIVNHRPHAGEAIRLRGEDISTGQVILSAGTRIGPAESGQLASVGLARVPVFRRFRVAVFSTGDELAMPGELLRDGAIYNSNRYVLRSLLSNLGCEVEDLGIVEDTLEATRAALRRAAACDLIVTSGGVSVGEEDHVKPAVEAEGRLEMWKIAIKPGKPLAFGRVGEAAAFIGLPGNPVSALVTFQMLVRPFILRSQGVLEVVPRAHSVAAAFDWPRPDRRREFLRARLNAEGRLELYPNQSSGVLTSCVWADGLVDNPPDTTIAAGEMVRFIPFSELLY